MKLENFVPYGRQQSGTVIIEFTTKLDVSDKYILEQQYHNRLENKAMHLFLRLKMVCNNSHILKIYNQK